MNYKNKKYAEILDLLPFFLCLLFIPLIVIVHRYDNPLIDYAWYLSYSDAVDFFLYYKSVAIIGCGIIILLLACKQYKKKRIEKKDWMVLLPLVVYELLAVLSSVFSEFAWFSFHGMPDQFESLFVLVAYGLVCIYAFWYVYEGTEKQMKQIYTMLLCGVLLIGIICTLQFFNIDIYRMIYDQNQYTFTFRLGQVYGSFYNINYVGSYVTLVLPIIIMALFSDVNWGYRIAGGIAAVLLLIALIGGESSAGVIAVIASTCCGLIYLGCRKLHDWKKNLLIIVGITIVGGILFGKPVSVRFASAIQAASIEKNDLESIITNDDNVEFHYKGHTLYVTMNMTEDQLFIIAKDEDQQTVACRIEMDGSTGYYRIDDERFDNCKLEPMILSKEENQFGVVVHLGDFAWCISNQIDGTGSYYYVTPSRKATKLTGEEVSGDFPGLENVPFLFNGRGYLWNKSLVVSKEYILLGSGADTFAIVYPNDDYVDKSNNGYGGMVVTRPHNMYLQIAVQTGWLSLICFLILCGWYLVNSLRIYYNKKFDTLDSYIGFGITLGVFGYLVAGIANDSTVTVAPVFWMLLGIGIAINHNLKRRQDA